MQVSVFYRIIFVILLHACNLLRECMMTYQRIKRNSKFTTNWTSEWLNGSQKAKHCLQAAERWKLFYRLQVVFQWRRWADSGKDRPVHTAARSCTVDAARRPSSVTESVRQRRTPSLSRRSISPLRCPNTTCTNHITHARTPQAQMSLRNRATPRKIVLLFLCTSASLLVHNFENRGYLL